MIPLYSTTIRRREMDAVLTCMVEEKIGPGEAAKRLALAFKDFLKCDGAVALRSPSVALRYALCALGIKAGDKVMVSSLAPAWQMIAAEQMGCEVIALDVEEESAAISADSVSKGMKAGGRVLLLHETCGLLPDMQSITSLGVQIIEDISQSIGAVYKDASNGEENDIKAGMFGVYSIAGLEEHDALTAGGGAVLVASKRREWTVLKRLIDEAASTDLLPDLNSALALAELKEFVKNEDKRREIYALYQRAVLSSGNRTLPRDVEEGDVAVSFPVVLSRSYKDAKQYADKKEIEIGYAFNGTVIAKRQGMLSASCKNAAALSLRTVLFPLYARLTSSQVQKVAKVIGTLP